MRCALGFHPLNDPRIVTLDAVGERVRELKRHGDDEVTIFASSSPHCVRAASRDGRLIERAVALRVMEELSSTGLWHIPSGL
jgi:hypothetical protein